MRSAFLHFSMLITIDFDCHRRPALIGLCFSGSLPLYFVLFTFLCHYLTWQINPLSLSCHQSADWMGWGLTADSATMVPAEFQMDVEISTYFCKCGIIYQQILKKCSKKDAKMHSSHIKYPLSLMLIELTVYIYLPCNAHHKLVCITIVIMTTIFILCLYIQVFCARQHIC